MDAMHTKPTFLSERSIDDLIVLIDRFELTLEYIAAAAGVYSTDESSGKRFIGIRDTAQEMINEYRERH